MACTKIVKLRVAVIGAGPAGLAMCRQLVNEQGISCVVFEKADQLGGVWVYTKDKQNVKHHSHSAMYANLRTNLPKEISAYRGFPYPENILSYMKQEDVLKYLQNYADHFELRGMIKLNNEVVSIKPCHNNESLSWQVKTKCVHSDTENTEMFDAVVVCNGHDSDPIIPEVPGIKNFPGIVMHSFHYNEPEVFRNKIVLILGGRSSAIDLCVEASKVARKVYMVHHGEKIPASFPDNVEEVIGTLTHAYGDGSVDVANEYRIKVDSVIFCTGYRRSFSFLSSQCEIKVTKNRVTSLYKHVFNTAYPTMSFIGLCNYWPTFPLFNLQAQWVTSILTGRKALPSREEMVHDEEREYEERMRDDELGSPDLMHSLGVKRLKPYADSIAQLAGVSPLPPVIFSLYKYNGTHRSSNFLTYRNTNYSATDDEFHVVEN